MAIALLAPTVTSLFTVRVNSIGSPTYAFVLLTLFEIFNPPTVNSSVSELFAGFQSDLLELVTMAVLVIL